MPQFSRDTLSFRASRYETYLQRSHTSCTYDRSSLPGSSSLSTHVPNLLLAWSPSVSHLLDLPCLLLYRQTQELVCCNLHKEGVENPNLFGVDIPDEGRLFPETFSYLWAQGRKGEMKLGKDLFLNSNPAGALQAEDGAQVKVDNSGMQVPQS